MSARGVPPPLTELQTCMDFEAAACDCMPLSALEYISGGEADTMARNRAAFSSFIVRPRVLQDVSAVDLQCHLFGSPCRTPFYLSSIAKPKLVTPEGEATFIRAAATAGSQFLIPSVSSMPLSQAWDTVNVTMPGQKLPFQFYLLREEDESLELLQEAIHLGISAVVVTVDANAPRSGSFLRSTASSTGTAPSPRLTWARLAEVRKLVPPNVPLYLKGVQTAEDALQAVHFGVQGIIVSNHGGRCCGDARSALDALEEVSVALRSNGKLNVGSASGTTISTAMGDVELYFDSGVRTGRDAFKALCLGARGIGIGRPYYWAAACHGEKGVVQLLQILTGELQHAMAQAGAAALGALGPAMLCRTTPAPQLLSLPVPINTKTTEDGAADIVASRL